MEILNEISCLKAVFIDRDGVINRKAPAGDYIKNWDEFEFLPRVAEAIRTLNEKDFKVIVVTNQRGVALGLMTIDDVEEIHERMVVELLEEGAFIDRIYYCPHEKDTCFCRKPDVGMFLQAKKDFPEISFADSFVIGDSITDIEAGEKLSCKCILISENLSAAEMDASSLGSTSLYNAVNDILIPRRHNFQNRIE